MIYHYDQEERCRQITVLLAYPKVGPLSASAIATNLGTSEDDIRAALEALLEEGRIVQTSDGRLCSPTAQPLRGPGRCAGEPLSMAESQARAMALGPVSRHKTGLDRRGPG